MAPVNKEKDRRDMKSAVTLIFFNRPDTLQKVFEKVREARPPKLFLVQDGAREGNVSDAERILQCRRIVENIDWECEVHKDYSERNLGCGIRPQSGITWVLSQVDSTIILEDDCVPDLSFFAYCDELLERYAHDERICYISGLNHFEEWDFGGSSYGFTKGGAIWGWATWRRAWMRYDYEINKIQDKYIQKQIMHAVSGEVSRVSSWIETNKKVTEDVRLSYWDVQWGFTKYAQNQLVIVPKNNLINNIGVGMDSTHAHFVESIHKKYSDFNNMPVCALDFPLVHPWHVLPDKDYDDMLIQCKKKKKKSLFRTALMKRILKMLGRKQ